MLRSWIISSQFRKIRRLQVSFSETLTKEIFLEAGSVSLSFSGNQGSSPEFETLLEAFDGDKRVVVVSSQEAIGDYGLPAVQQRASEKYDAQLFDAAGRIKVLTSDF
jgi:hypothetical protein